MARDKENFAKLTTQGDILYNDSDYVSALPYFLKAEKIAPKDGLLLYKIAFCYDKGEKDLVNAKKYYERSLKFLKTNDHISEMAGAYFNLGVIAQRKDNFEEKYNHFAAAYSLLSKIEEMGKASGIDFFRLGYYAMDSKQYDLSIKYFKKAIHALSVENPNHFYHAGAYFNIGKIYWDNNDIKQALSYWKKALDLEPDNAMYKEWYDKALLEQD